jgi:hypothetical protein
LVVGSSILAVILCACAGRSNEQVQVDEEAESWDAFDYCRTTTCAPPTGWPKGKECEPAGWAEECSRKGSWDVPLWWRTGCVGYGVEQSGSARVSYEDAQRAAAAAFAAWTSASCSDGNGNSSDDVHPSIDVRDVGALDCDHAAWNPEGPNQHVIAFHDDVWPHADGAGTLAQTLVTYDPRTGEILDADIEVNEANYDIRVLTAGEPTAGAYDLQVVLTHEAGHLFGLAHSSNHGAVMYPSGDQGVLGLNKRSLARPDTDGICAVYPPGGTRSVATSVDASGAVASGACDPTPAGGFASSCR